MTKISTDINYPKDLFPKGFHTSMAEDMEREKNKTLMTEKIEIRPRRFGKSTLVTDAFLAACRAGEAVKYEHPDYVVLSRKAFEELQRLT